MAIDSNQPDISESRSTALGSPVGQSELLECLGLRARSMWTIGVGLRMSTLDSNVAGSIPASICFLLEQETLSALLQSTQL